MWSQMNRSQMNRSQMKWSQMNGLKLICLNYLHTSSTTAWKVSYSCGAGGLKPGGFEGFKESSTCSPCTHLDKMSHNSWSLNVVILHKLKRKIQTERLDASRQTRNDDAGSHTYMLTLKHLTLTIRFFWYGGLLLALYDYNGLVAPILSSYNFWFQFTRFFVFCVCSLQLLRTLCAW